MAEESEEITLQIPVGIEEGSRLRIPGRGMRGPEGSPPGDLLIAIHSTHPRFRRKGKDLWVTEVLPIEDAVLGTSIELRTLDRPVVAVVPAGTQPGSILRLAGKGLPAYGEGPRGDLMVVIEVALPEQLDEEERRLFQRLRDLHRIAGRIDAGTRA